MISALTCAAAAEHAAVSAACRIAIGGALGRVWQLSSMDVLVATPGTSVVTVVVVVVVVIVAVVVVVVVVVVVDVVVVVAIARFMAAAAVWQPVRLAYAKYGPGD